MFTDDADGSITTNPATLTVVKATPVITITPSQNPITPGDTLTIQVGLSSDILGANQPIFGHLDLTIGNFHQSTLYYDNPMSFTIPMGMLPGVYTVTASYDGTQDPVFGSAVATTTQVVVKASSSIEGYVPSPTATVGETATLIGVVTGTGGINPPSGRVLFTDNGQPIGFGELAPSGDPGVSIATFTTAPLTVGGHYFQMVYQGDTETYASASGVSPVQVVQPTKTNLTSNTNPSIQGAVIAFTAAVVDADDLGHATSGAVDWYIGGVLVASSTVDGQGVATLATSALVPGYYTLVAQYRGDGVSQASASQPYIQVVYVPVTTQTSLASSLNPSRFGDSVTFAAQVVDTKGVDQAWSGNVDFYVASTLVATVPIDVHGRAEITTSALIPGAFTMTARYEGAPGVASSTSPQVVQIVEMTTTTTLTSSANPANQGDEITFTATVAAQDESLDNPAWGVVEFYIGGVLVFSSPLDAQRQAALTTSALVPGAYTLTAWYRGFNEVQPSTSAALVQIVNTAGTTAAVASTRAAAPALVPTSTPTTTAQPTRFRTMRARIVAPRATGSETRAIPQRLITAHRWR